MRTRRGDRRPQSRGGREHAEGGGGRAPMTAESGQAKGRWEGGLCRRGAAEGEEGIGQRRDQSKGVGQDGSAGKGGRRNEAMVVRRPEARGAVARSAQARSGARPGRPIRRKTRRARVRQTVGRGKGCTLVDRPRGRPSEEGAVVGVGTSRRRPGGRRRAAERTESSAGPAMNEETRKTDGQEGAERGKQIMLRVG